MMKSTFPFQWTLCKIPHDAAPAAGETSGQARPAAYKQHLTRSAAAKSRAIISPCSPDEIPRKYDVAATLEINMTLAADARNSRALGRQLCHQTNCE